MNATAHSPTDVVARRQRRAGDDEIRQAAEARERETFSAMLKEPCGRRFMRLVLTRAEAKVRSLDAGHYGHLCHAAGYVAAIKDLERDAESYCGELYRLMLQEGTEDGR